MKALQFLFGLVGISCAVLSAQPKNAKSFKLTVSAFSDRGLIPRHFTCDGENVSPPMTWSGEPQGTQSFALTLDDRDAPTGFVHWLLWDIPASVHSLAEGVNAMGTSGTNGFGKRGYGGPCPPSGSHLYAFQVLAIDVPSLNLAAGAKRPDLDRALRKHVLAKVEYDGVYGHN
jgi:Raf kinase inhibitor-like YbhB/YbcL family protein